MKTTTTADFKEDVVLYRDGTKYRLIARVPGDHNVWIAMITNGDKVFKWVVFQDDAALYEVSSMRTATVDDFKCGVVLHRDGREYQLVHHVPCKVPMWLARVDNDYDTIHLYDAKLYQIAKDSDTLDDI